MQHIFRGRLLFNTIFGVAKAAGPQLECVSCQAARELSNSFSSFSGRIAATENTSSTQSARSSSCEGRQSQLHAYVAESQARTYPWQYQSLRNKLTVKPTTKNHRFTIHLKVDRELAIRSYWQNVRGVTDPALLQRFINFARIYARYRDLDYLKHTMRDWDAAIDRLFDHDRGMEPANNLARRHPYVLNTKIKPLQFAKNAVAGHLPLYDWRAVLKDLKRDVESGPRADEPLQQHVDGRTPAAMEVSGLPADSFKDAKKISASL